MLILSLGSRAAQRVAAGYPWVFRSDVVNAKELDNAEPGTVAVFSDPHNRVIATGITHPKAQLLGRVLAKGEAVIDAAFFAEKFQAALNWRQLCFPGQDYYRLIHADSDGLSGLIIDRFGDTIVCQVNSLGMEKLQPVWLPVLQEITGAKNIVLKNDSNGRSQENLPENFSVAKGTIPENSRVQLVENNVKFYADIHHGQKTGWFYDQRPHRQWVAGFAKDKTLLDVFCHTGGFGMTALAQGAKHVTFVDSAGPALALVQANAELNKVADKCEMIDATAFELLEKLRDQGKKFDIVCVDPPAFVKSKKDMITGLKGYEKLARLAASLIVPDGILFYASCSSHPTEGEVLQAIINGAAKARRIVSLVYTGGAGPDHPVHPMLPETRYLKAFGFRVTA